MNTARFMWFGNGANIHRKRETLGTIVFLSLTRLGLQYTYTHIMA